MSIFSKLAFWKSDGPAQDDFSAAPFPSQFPGVQGMQQGQSGQPEGMGQPQGFANPNDPYSPQSPQFQDNYSNEYQEPKQTSFMASPGGVPLGGFQQPGQGMQSGQSGQPQDLSHAQQQLQQSTIDKDFQIISLKLDAIKSDLDAMKHRIEKIERIAESETSKGKKVEYGW